MKLSDLRPCDNCGRKIAPAFYVVRFSLALFDVHKTNQTLGLTQFFQGQLSVAEAFAPDAVLVAMDEREHKGLMVELFICARCFTEPLCLAELAEKRARANQAPVTPET